MCRVCSDTKGLGCAHVIRQGGIEGVPPQGPQVMPRLVNTGVLLNQERYFRQACNFGFGRYFRNGACAEPMGREASANTDELHSNALSIDHSPPIAIKQGDPLFFSVKAGMTVIVQHLPELGHCQIESQWWMADA